MTDKGEGKRAKRGQGEGSYKTLPSGRVRWRTSVRSKAGEQRNFSGTARNLTEARRAVRDVREAAERDSLPPREKVTIEQLVSAYIRHRTPSFKGRTVKNYNAILKRNITPSIGALKAQGVSVPRLREYYDTLRETQGDSVRRQVHNLIHAAYRLGLADGTVSVNPAARVRPLYAPSGAARLKSFDPEQAARFYQAARADRWGYPLAFMLATGLRPGEALGLTWDEVTFTDGGRAVVRIERTRSVVGGEVYEDTPKTDRGRRSLSLSGDAVTLLRDSQAQTRKEAGARLSHNGHPYQVTNYVFTSRAGTPYRPDNLRRPMNRLCDMADVPRLTPHKLRHTYVSVMAEQGVSIEVLSAQIGHKDGNVTRGFYRHVFESERLGLTYDPTPPQPASQPRRRVTLKARPPALPTEAAPERRTVKARERR